LAQRSAESAFLREFGGVWHKDTQII